MTKILAFFLPQFHDDPLNSKWWGKGFTEWVNVKAAKPLHAGHRQPRVPLNGYYDLETPEALNAQFDEASDHNIDGFVFYHYWSKGTRLLRKPLDLLLANPEVGKNQTFSLCWANHAWTRSWKNRSGALDVLLEQEYESSKEERAEHIDFLVRCFSDPRYLKTNGKPLLCIYSPEIIPQLDAFIEELREKCIQVIGADCEISGVIKNWQSDWSFLSLLDSVTLAQPALSQYASPDIFDKTISARKLIFSPSEIARGLPAWAKKLLYPIQDRFFNRVTFIDYDSAWQKGLEQIRRAVESDRKVHVSTFVDFDNTARYGPRAKIFTGFTLEKFSDYFEKAYRLAQKNTDSGLLMVNAWNEWAEGMYLQPDEEFGNARLEIIREIVAKNRNEKSAE
ncbi:glycoside hydrolase family 99-like domain-containing protein [Parasphingorhabdus sp.]|uniref:glycosyltransferase WbsX family protein n=1 Tax=Parasphingorhabdus sp. TaxID=2709688 RepID=UPI003A91E202